MADEQPGRNDVAQNEDGQLVITGFVREFRVVHRNVVCVELEEEAEVPRVRADRQHFEQAALFAQQGTQEDDVDRGHDHIDDRNRIGLDRKAVDQERQRAGEAEQAQLHERLARQRDDDERRAEVPDQLVDRVGRHVSCPVE